jgi:UDP-glucuronate 4-epimerase
MRRDFTYIDDIAEGVVRTLDTVAEPSPCWNGEQPDPGTSSAPYRIYNIGNNNPVELLRFIEILERETGREAIKRFVDLQAGDALATYADVDDLEAAVGFRPRTSIEDGLARFVAWYREYYGI